MAHNLQPCGMYDVEELSVINGKYPVECRRNICSMGTSYVAKKRLNVYISSCSLYCNSRIMGLKMEVYHMGYKGYSLVLKYQAISYPPALL